MGWRAKLVVMPHFLDIQTPEGIATLVLHPLSSTANTRKIAVDASGDPCTRAWMAEDHALFLPGCAAQNHEDTLGNTITRDALLTVDDAGSVMRPLPPTTGLVQNLEGPVPPDVLLEHLVRKVYWAEASNDISQLLDGAIYRTSFRPVASSNNDPCFLLGSADLIFLSQCVPIHIDWLGPEDGCVPEVEDDAALDEEDWL